MSEHPFSVVVVGDIRPTCRQCGRDLAAGLVVFPGKSVDLPCGACGVVTTFTHAHRCTVDPDVTIWQGSEPSTWPTTPPTEPGWYWVAYFGGPNGLLAPEVVHVEMEDGAPAVVHGDGTVTMLRSLEGRWRPGAITP